MIKFRDIEIVAVRSIVVVLVLWQACYLHSVEKRSDTIAHWSNFSMDAQSREDYYWKALLGYFVVSLHLDDV